MLAKSYVLGMARRPITVYDASWQLVCMLCTKLPTIENGLAVPEDLLDGRRGIAVTYTLRPDAPWGSGTPVFTADVVFTWGVGRQPLLVTASFALYCSSFYIYIKGTKSSTLSPTPTH